MPSWRCVPSRRCVGPRNWRQTESEAHPCTRKHVWRNTDLLLGNVMLRQLMVSGTGPCCSGPGNSPIARSRNVVASLTDAQKLFHSIQRDGVVLPLPQAVASSHDHQPGIPGKVFVPDHSELCFRFATKTKISNQTSAEHNSSINDKTHKNCHQSFSHFDRQAPNQ